MTKEPLKLDQQVVVDLATSPLTPNLILLVDRFQQKVPKLGNHVNLLQNRYHVANATKVGNASVNVARLGRGLVGPTGRRRQILDHRPQVVLHELCELFRLQELKEL